jgi:hypothetical protein
MENLEGQSYGPVGKCIYCGSTNNLSREHIVPVGLSGTAVLLAASCDACARVTGKVERALLRGSMWPVRVLRQLRSRRPREAPKTESLEVERHGKLEKLQIALEEYPVLLPLPIFEMPAELGGPPTPHGVLVKGLHTISFGPRPGEVMQRLGATRVRLTRSDQPGESDRLVAKIAYCYAIAQLGSDAFERVFVLNGILGRQDDIGRWVGTWRDVAGPYPGLLHRLSLQQTGEAVLVEVQLFADSETPSYIVVVGQLKRRVE